MRLEMHDLRGHMILKGHSKSRRDQGRSIFATSRPYRTFIVPPDSWLNLIVQGNLKWLQPLRLAPLSCEKRLNHHP